MPASARGASAASTASTTGAPVPATSARAASVPAAAQPEERESYSTLLTVGYVLAPLLAIPVGAGLFELTRNDAVSVVGAGLAVVGVPFAIHAYHGEPGRGALSAFLSPVATLAASAVGALAGGLIGTSGCDDDSDCELAYGMSGAITGALIGGVAGYVGYAIYDVSENSSVAPAEPQSGAVRVWALPVMARQEGSTNVTPRVDGAMVGTAFAF